MAALGQMTHGMVAGGATSDAEAPAARSPLARIAANTAWLLGGKGFGAVCGLLYLAIITRSLGLKGFGHFSLIFGTAQALIAIAGFQSWRIVVRYGAPHVHAGEWREFGRLGMFAGLLDAFGAAFGCLVAYLLFYHSAGLIRINPNYVDPAFWFCCAMLWSLVSAPTGIVRALDRFDMAVYVEALVPIGRLAAAVGIWLTGPSVVKFLIAWAAVDLLEAAAYWIMARWLCPDAVRLRHLREWRLVTRDNPGIHRFAGITYAAATLEAAVRYGPLLAVGALVGTRAAGLFRLASQLSQALSKLSTLLTRAVYAEVARTHAAHGAAEFRKLAVQTSLIAGAAGAVVVTIALVAGSQLLALLGGAEFARGGAILIPLAIAASFDLASVAFEPVLHSTGRARYALLSRAAAVIALGAAMIALERYGAPGIAWAVAVAGAITYLALGGFARRTLAQMERAG
ncbi:MAG: lipopolysaccharide biosynthesis protein [Novosphingobium sp.]|nr:lipopolysaccharide biosynthesis protein [Novosphingobium sp.]